MGRLWDMMKEVFGMVTAHSRVRGKATDEELISKECRQCVQCSRKGKSPEIYEPESAINMNVMLILKCLGVMHCKN